MVWDNGRCGKSEILLPRGYESSIRKKVLNSLSETPAIWCVLGTKTCS